MTQRKTNQPDTQSPYAGELKIGVASADLKALRPVADACDVHLLPMEVPTRGGDVYVSGSSHELTSLPVGLIGFMSLTKASQLSVRKVREQLQAKFACTLPEEIEVGKGEQSQAVACALARRLAFMQTSMARRNTELMRGMGAIRAAHELTQESFQRLEAFAYTRNLLVRDLALSMDPTKYAVALGGAASASSLQQMLPVSSVGVCEVAVHLHQEIKFKDGQLQVQLATLEDGKIVHRWTVPGTSLPRGWLHLGLARAMDTDAKTLMLSLDWSGKDMLTLSLSMAHPQEQWRARTPLQELERVLSVKVWNSLPGVRPVPSPNALAGEASAWKTAPLGPEVLQHVENVSATPDAGTFVADRRAILVHPQDGKPVWCRLRGAIPAGVSYVRARIETVNAQGGPVEYAMAVVPTGGDPRLPLADGSDALMTQWSRIACMTPGQLHLVLDAPMTEAADLYLGTRVRTGESNAFCWAHFSSISLAHSFGPIG